MVLDDSNSIEGQPVVDFGQCVPASGLESIDGPVVAGVKICGGTVFCPEGKQDSLDLGLQLEERLHNIYLPANMSIGVSGCVNRCAETCSKDIGIVGMQDGWDLYVGGSGRVSRNACLLAKSLSTERVLEVVDRILALFRFDNNGKRLSALIEGIGFDNFKAKVLVQDKAECE